MLVNAAITHIVGASRKRPHRQSHGTQITAMQWRFYNDVNFLPFIGGSEMKHIFRGTYVRVFEKLANCHNDQLPAAAV